MRVLALVPFYGPNVPTGAFITTREYLRSLAERGHLVHVVTTATRQGRPIVDDTGVHVWPLARWQAAARTCRPDIAISHHGDRRAPAILPWAVRRGRELLMVHGESDNLNLGSPGLAWFPSEAAREFYGYTGRTLILPPAIDVDAYATTFGGHITLSGSTVAKGADVFAELAHRMPGRRFLLVRAAKGHDAGDVDLPNVRMIDRTDPREVFEQTAILLMPSTTETYGRIGIEAMASGIPVLAAPLPGIREALGSAATYIPRGNLPLWVAQIQLLLDDRYAYNRASVRARGHAAAVGVNHGVTLAEFEAACMELAGQVALA